MSTVQGFADLQRVTDAEASDHKSYLDFLAGLEARFPEASEFINSDYLSEAEVDSLLVTLRAIDSGGFSHESVGGNYGREQLNASRALSRSYGYLGIASLLQRDRPWRRDHVLFDALAGNGTFDRVMQKLNSQRPRYVGNDISMTMVRQAHTDNRLVFYSDLRTPVLREAFADYGVSAYGTHHVPPDERQAFTTAACQRLKPGGTFVLQDFVEGSATARWYSECIDQFRSHGHDYRHFRPGELAILLRNAGLVNASEHLLYDPFIVRLDDAIDDDQARRGFYEYLIDLFALDRLKRIAVDELLSLRTLDNLLSPYFRLEDSELAAVQADESVPPELIEANITIKTVAGSRQLIAPRVAIAAVGTRASVK